MRVREPALVAYTLVVYKIILLNTTKILVILKPWYLNTPSMTRKHPITNIEYAVRMWYSRVSLSGGYRSKAVGHLIFLNTLNYNQTMFLWIKYHKYHIFIQFV